MLTNSDFHLGYEILDIYDNDCYYIGDVLNAQQHGYGCEYRRDKGLKVCEGNYINGNATGYVKIYTTSDSFHSFLAFTGILTHGKADGRSNLYFNNGKLKSL